MSTQRASSRPSIRDGPGPPACLTFNSTSSTIVRTWRGLVPLVRTKASVIDTSSPMAKITVSWPCLSDAARAASTASSLTWSSEERGLTGEGLRTALWSCGSSKGSKGVQQHGVGGGGVGSGVRGLAPLQPLQTEEDDRRQQHRQQESHGEQLLAKQSLPVTAAVVPGSGIRGAGT